MQIDTQRLRLRPVTANDVEVLHRIWTDAGVRRDLWDDRVIELGETPIGFTGFRSSEEDARPELLYGLLPQYWKRGYATEAARAALDYLRGRGMHSVRAATDVPNAASVAVMERLGMTLEKCDGLLFYAVR